MAAEAEEAGGGAEAGGVAVTEEEAGQDEVATSDGRSHRCLCLGATSPVCCDTLRLGQVNNSLQHRRRLWRCNKLQPLLTRSAYMAQVDELTVLVVLPLFACIRCSATATAG